MAACHRLRPYPAIRRAYQLMRTHGFRCARGPVGFVCHGRSAGRRAVHRLVLPGFAFAWWTRSIGRFPRPRTLSVTNRSVAPRPITARLVLPRPIATVRTNRFVAPVAARLRRISGLVPIALRRGIFFRPRALGTILFLEPVARIFVRAAGTPVAAPPLRRRPIALRLPRRRRRVALHLEIVALRLPRLPQLPACEPAHRDVWALPLELYERRLELLALPRAESRRLLVDQNRPVGMAGRHPAILTGSWRGACYYQGSAPKRRIKESSRAKRPDGCVCCGDRAAARGPDWAQESDGTLTSVTSGFRLSFNVDQNNRDTRVLEHQYERFLIGTSLVYGF